MFDVARFVAECEAGISTGGGRGVVRETLMAAISNPAGIVAVLGEPKRAGVQILHRSPSLTIVHVAWAPSYTQAPHNHLVWAEIGVYSGREDNIFWRRLPQDAAGRVEAAGAKALCEKDAEPLGRDIIHSVTNPIPRLTAAIHVYGGDFFAAERSEWDPETLAEQRWDPERAVRRFEEANRTLAAE